MKHVYLYTDGSCIGNPGPGGYGTILVFEGRGRELSAGYARTTNNRMELMAVIAGLEALKEPCEVSLYTDSKYVRDALSHGWARRWRANGWRKGPRKRERVKNPDLWERLLDASEPHELHAHWLKGHAGHAENERCDELANRAATGEQLGEDPGYTDPPVPPDPQAKLL